jgi:hypothetical protein
MSRGGIMRERRVAASLDDNTTTTGLDFSTFRLVAYFILPLVTNSSMDRWE